MRVELPIGDQKSRICHQALSLRVATLLAIDPRAQHFWLGYANRAIQALMMSIFGGCSRVWCRTIDTFVLETHATSRGINDRPLQNGGYYARRCVNFVDPSESRDRTIGR